MTTKNKTPETIPRLLAAPAARTALIAAETGVQTTYGQLAERVGDLAAELTGAGVGRGDTVAVALHGGQQLVETLLAVVSLGAAAAPLNPAYTDAEFRFYLEDLRPKAVLVPAGEMEPARKAAAALALGLIDALDEDGRTRLVAPPGAAAANGGPEPGDVALLLHTSGTTSRPKQVPLRHANLMASVAAVARHYALTDADVSLCLMPLFHVHGLVASVWAQLHAGGSVVLMPRLSGRVFAQSLSEYAVTWYSASPTMHQMVLAHGGRAERLRFVRSCSSALPAELFDRLGEAFGIPVVEAYGMTEASHQIASNPLPPGRSLAGSVGLPTGTEIAVVDGGGAPVAVGAGGEVVIRGAGVMNGYLNNDEANTEAFLAGGWFRTGDLGRLDEDGYLRLSGRLKELIIRGGENIAPYEVEDVLLAHPAVRDAVCFGVPDEKYGEDVAAAVATDVAVTERELREFCRARLAAFKVPKTIHVLDALPRTATGKVQRRRMPALLERGQRD